VQEREQGTGKGNREVEKELSRSRRILSKHSGISGLEVKAKLMRSKHGLKRLAKNPLKSEQIVDVLEQGKRMQAEEERKAIGQ